MIQTEVTFQLHGTSITFIADGIIRCLLYKDLLVRAVQMFVCKTYVECIWACVVGKYMRVCLAYVYVERTHEKKMATYLWKKTHRAEKIASIRGK